MACCGGRVLTNEEVLGANSSSLSRSLYGRRRRNSSASSSCSSSTSSSSTQGVGAVFSSSNCKKSKKKKRCPKPKKYGSEQARELQITTAAQPFSTDNAVLDKLNSMGFTRQYVTGGVTPGSCGNCAGDISTNLPGDNGQMITLYNHKTGQSATYDLGSGHLALSGPPKKKKKKHVLYVKQYEKQDPCAIKKQPCQKKRCAPTRHPPICESYPPKRNDCYPATPKPYELAYNTYFDEGFDVGTSSTNTWNWFTSGDPTTNPNAFIANDTAITAGIGKGLTFDSHIYTKTYPQTADGPDPDGFLDHFKAVAMSTSVFCVKEEGELYAEATMSAGVNPATSQLVNLGYFDNMYNPGSDPRVAYSTFSLLDAQNNFALHHVFTNGTLYAAMERWPFTRGVGSTAANPQAFMSIKPLYRRADATPMEHYMQVGIGFDRKLGAKWYVNGSLAHTEAILTEPAERSDILGDYGGVYTDARPLVQNLQVMFGHWSYLDGMNSHQASTIAQVQQREFVQQTEPPRALANLRAVSPTVNRTYSNSTYYEVATDTTFTPRPVNYVKGQVDESGGTVEAVHPTDRVFGQGASLHMLNLKVQYRC